MPSCCVSDILGNTPVYVARAALYTAVTDRLRGVDTPAIPQLLPPPPGPVSYSRLGLSPIGRRGPRRAAGRCGLRLVRGATDTRRDRFGGCRCSGRGRETGDRKRR